MRQQNERSVKGKIKKSWKQKSKKTMKMLELLTETYWPKVLISRDNRISNRTENVGKATPTSPSADVESSKSDRAKITTSSDVEELCGGDADMSFEDEKISYPISNAAEIDEYLTSASGSYTICEEDRSNERIVDQKKQMVDQDPLADNFTEDLSCSNYEEANNSESISIANTIVSRTKCYEEEPIFVDLTTDESKVTWKQTILKRFCDGNLEGTSCKEITEDESDMTTDIAGESRVMIADSSCRLQRDTSGSSLTTALKDRGSCVIPVQPNRSLPIHPAPPAPTRTARKERTSVLKLSKATLLDIVEVEPAKSIVSKTCAEVPVKEHDNNFEELEINEENVFTKSSIESSTFVVPQILSVECLASVKRKANNDEEHQECVKDSKKKKSQEADSSQAREDGVEGVSMESSRNYDATMAGIPRQEVSEGACKKRCDTSGVISTADESVGKNKEIGNKLVPPLRLKKINRAETDGFRNLEVTAETEVESDYRIVTGCTPQPKLNCGSSCITTSWTSEDNEKDTTIEITLKTANSRDNGIRRSVTKSDSHKLRHRRNRLKQKLEDLRSKVVQLTEQMANPSSTCNPSSCQSTTLRQAMNRYEKQIENLSKLLNKLSAAMPITSNIVSINDNNETYTTRRLTVIDLNEEKHGSPMKNISPPASPEPPKLSPRSPLDYHKNCTCEEIRNSPPILPRVCPSLSPNFHSVNEDVETGDEMIWTTEENSSAKITLNSNVIAKENLNNIQAPSRNLLTAAGSGNIVENVDLYRTNIKDTVESLNATNKDIMPNDNSSLKRIIWEKTESLQEKKNSMNILSSSTVAKEREQLKNCKLGGTENDIAVPIIDSVGVDLEAPTNVLCERVSPITRIRENCSSTLSSIRKLNTNCYGSSVARDKTVLSEVMEDIQTRQKVTSSSNQCEVIDCTSILPTFDQVDLAAGTQNQQRLALQRNYEIAEPHTNSMQRREDNRFMTEQFPTLGNWVARLSKKQISKSRSRLHTAGATVSTEEIRRIPENGVKKLLASSIKTSSRNVINVKPQWDTERWQRQQRQQQKLLHASSSTPSQPLSVPQLRPNICPPIPMTQFYPNSYTVDPYGGTTLNYHAAMCPYSTYPYHTRLHSTPPSMTGYHLPIQNTLSSPMRPLQHLHKRISPLQESVRHFPSDILKYPESLPTTNFHHPNAMDFDRLRGPTSSSNIGTSTCLPPLLLSPPSLASTGQQSLPRTITSSYSTNNGHFSRNRMIPDVVAAAAAAAVVAAASFSRQNDPLSSYNRTESDATSTTGISNQIDGVAPHTAATHTNKFENSNRDLGNQAQTNIRNSNEETRLTATEYQHLQNLLLDRMPCARNAETLASTTLVGDRQTTSISAPTAIGPYQVSSLVTSRQLSKDVSREDSRNCETPHLGKVNPSPNASDNLLCSNCGLTGSMFKCLGCGNAFYCNERCQTLHWSIHVEKCPKKMPKLKKVS